MATALPQFETFDIHSDGNVGVRFKKWIKRLENLFVAAAIADEKRQRALLLHYGGQDIYDIYETLENTGEDFTTLKTKLTEHFEPKKNKEYAVYVFRQAKQTDGESMDEFVTRLRQLASDCEFQDKDGEIKSQIIQCCSSNRLRRKALKTPNITLTNLLDEARSLEISESQALGIESTQVLAVKDMGHRQKNKDMRPMKNSSRRELTSSTDQSCFRCGEPWPHNGNCPARSRKCNKCSRTGHFAEVCKSS